MSSDAQSLPHLSPTYLTIPQAARHSGISEAGLRSRIRAGSLPHARVGPVNTIVIAKHDLDALLLLTGGGPRAMR